MSFGFSLGDLAALVALTKKTYDGWQHAPKEYADVVQTLGESNMLMCHVQRRFDVLTAHENDAGKQKEIGDLLKGCQSAVSDLRSVARRRRKLGHWDRIKLGASHISDSKDRLSRHLNILTPFLFSLELESIGKDISSLPAALDRIPHVLSHALPAALGKMVDERIEDSRTARGSIMTTYGDDDDKQAYKELRRNLRFFGIRDSVVRQHRRKLVEFVKTLTQDDGNTTASEKDGDQQMAEVQRIPSPSPELVPEGMYEAEDIGIGREKTVSTAEFCRYQAYVETEDEDEATESAATASSSEDTGKGLENTAKSQRSSENLAQAGNGNNNQTFDNSEPIRKFEAVATGGDDVTKATGQRKYQAYVETDDEDEDDATLGTLHKTPIDALMTEASEGSPLEAGKGVNVEAATQDLPLRDDARLPDHADPANIDNGTPTKYVDVGPDYYDQAHRSRPTSKPYGRSPDEESSEPERVFETKVRTARPRKAKSSVSTRAVCGDLDYQSSEDERFWESKDRVGRPKKAKAPGSTLAVCGDLDYQDGLEPVSDFDESNSAADHETESGCCSSCDQRRDPGGDEASYQDSSDDSNWSDAEHQSGSDDNVSKRAHSDYTEDEEDGPVQNNRFGKFAGHQKDLKHTKRGGRFEKFHAPDSEEAASRPRPSPMPQRVIEYKPLDVHEEGLLTIQLHMPAGFSVHIERDRIAQFHDRFASNTQRQYFSSLPSNDGVASKQCRHGFPNRLSTGVLCGSQILYWTPDLQTWNPKLVDGLRDWIAGRAASVE